MSKSNFMYAQRGASAPRYSREKSVNTVKLPVVSFCLLGMMVWTSFLLLWARFFASFLVQY